MQDAPHKRILILGDGFAGLTDAMELEKKLAQDPPQEYGHPASFALRRTDCLSVRLASNPDS